MTAMRSPRMSASSMKWVVRTIILSPRARSSSSQTCRRACGSMPDVGSSKKIILGLPMRAIARESLRFIPPDKCSDIVSALSSSPTSSILLATSASRVHESDIPLIAPNSSRCSFTVSLSNRMSC